MIQAAEKVVLTAQTDLSIIEKIQLIQKSTATTLEMAQGKNYDDASIKIQVQKELRKLGELNILDLESLEFGFRHIEFEMAIRHPNED